MNDRRGRLPSLAELQAFESAARHQSFTRAATELNLTQSAVSRQILNLELTVGVALFERVKRTVRLTDAGKVYVVDVQRILNQLSWATARIATFGTENVINLAVLPTFATRWLMPRLPKFIAAAGPVTVNCLVKLEPFDFESEPFDAAIHFGKGEWPGATPYFLLHEEIEAVASPKTVAEHKLYAPCDVQKAVLLHQTTRPSAWSEWFAAQGVENPPANQGPRIEQFGMIAAAAIAGIGVALLPRFLIMEEIQDGRLVVIASKPVKSGQAYWFVVPNRKQRRPKIDLFRRWLETETQILA